MIDRLNKWINENGECVKLMEEYLEFHPETDQDILIMKAIIAHLQSAVVVREGWKLVPCEATEEMTDRAYEQAPENQKMKERFWKLAWKRMLAAAPDYVEE